MKKNIVFIGGYLIVGVLLVFSSCNSTGSNSKNSSEEQLYEVVNQQTSFSPNCSGYGIYGGYACIVCNGTGQVQIDEVETRSSSDISFRGGSYIYGPCNSGCGCEQYVHAPGQTKCVNCEYYRCTSNKFGHKMIYK